MLRRLLAVKRSTIASKRRKRCFRFESLEGRELLAVFNWVSPVNGDFGVSANWLNTSTNAPGVPGAADTANIPGNIQVTSSTNRTVNTLNGSLRVSSGTFTLKNSGSDSLIVNLQVDSSASLSTLGGTTAIIGADIFGSISTAASANFRFQRGNLNLNTGATLTGTGQYRMEGDVFGGPVLMINANIAAPTNMVMVNGVLDGAGTFTISTPFEWRTGTMRGTGQTVVSSTGVVTVTRGEIVLSHRTLSNQGNFVFAATQASLNFADTGTFINQAGGLVDVQSNFSWNGGVSGLVQNSGIIRRSSGDANFRIGVRLINTGTIELQTGSMGLNLGTSTSGTFITSAGTTLDLTSGGEFTLAGTSLFQGTGTVLTGSGVLSSAQANTTWSIPTTVTFLWTGGTIVVPIGGAVTVNGNVTFAATNGGVLRGGGRLRMNGILNHTGLGSITMAGDLSTNSVATTLEILNGRQYIMRTDGGILNNSPGGVLVNSGTITKQAGNGTSLINVRLENSGNVVVNSGTLALHNTVHSAGTFTVAANKTLQLLDTASAQFLASGTVTLAGNGSVAISAGSFSTGATGGVMTVGPSVQLLWSGGEIAVPKAATYTINGNVNILSAVQVLLSGGGTLVLNGTTTHSNAGPLRLQGDGQSATSTLRIPAGQSYKLSGDASIVQGNGGGGQVDNLGLISKSAGPGTSLISVPMLKAANLQVDAGSLQLGIQNGTLQGGTWTVAAGAVLDLTSSSGIATTFRGTFTGSGAGQVQFNRGQLTTSPDVAGTTFDFPSGMFRLLGGLISTNSSTLTLKGNATYVGASDLFISGSGILKIVGSFNHQSTGNLNLLGPTTLNITATGTYSLGKDANIVGGVVDNDGLLRKTGGTGTSTINARLSNAGTVESRIGTLSITGPIDEITGGTLNSGRWNVVASANNTAVLNLNTAITTVGTAASVSLGGVGASMPSLASMNSLLGTLQLTSGVTLTTNGNLTNRGKVTIASSSVLQVTGNYFQTASGRLFYTISGGAIGRLKVNGNVNLTGFLTLSSSGALPAIGTSLTLIENLSASAVAGTFSGLPQNAAINFSGMTWTIRYNQGPGGNDVTITRTA